MKALKDRLGKEWLFCDGGTGTTLQKKGLKGGELPEKWNLSHPGAIVELHQGYYEAGADICVTNTFGANRFHYPDDLEEVVRAAVRNAKTARHNANRDEDAYVALDMGPTGKLLEPMGELSFEEAVQVYSEVVSAGTKEGIDLIFIETQTDTLEAKAAVLAAKENADVPVFVTMTFDTNGRLLTGGNVETAVAMLEGLHVDALGINCSLGPKQMFPIIKRITETASIPVIVNPNAGLPRVENGMTVYDVGPEEFAKDMKEVAKLGIQLAGGCCGTTKEHIKVLIDTLRPMPFIPNTEKNTTWVSSGSMAVKLDDHCHIVGERINPTGKKLFKQALINNDIDYILKQGLAQEDAGADILDVNVGLPDIDEAKMMETVVRSLQSVTSLPLQIDTTNIQALERALRIYNGKPMVNSTNGKQEVIEQVMPLVAKYGGVLVGLCLDEEGIPATADGRIKVAKKIYAAAEKYGIPKKDIILDGLTMTVSSDPESANVTLETIRRIRDELHGHSILGVSNISFGLPQRSIINSFFFAMAIQNGLNAAIINPNNANMMAAFRASLALLNKDPNCSSYIEAYANAESGSMASAASKKNLEKGVSPIGLSDVSLRDAIERGLITQAKLAAEKGLSEGKKSLDMINEELIPALDQVGKGFEAGTTYLPQLLMSADASKAAFEVFKKAMANQPGKIKGRIILATVKGDIHDIGKNIVKVMLENYGYEVLDLGKDVPPEVIVDTAIKENIRLVGLSALMTTTVGAMEDTIKLLKQKKPDTKTVVGGAVLTKEYAEKIGADAYAKDAMATVRYADQVFAE